MNSSHPGHFVSPLCHCPVSKVDEIWVDESSLTESPTMATTIKLNEYCGSFGYFQIGKFEF